MFGFLLFMGLATIVGIHLGVISVLSSKGVKLGRSFLYSLFLYTMPISIVSAHINLYKERHDILNKLLKNKKVSDIKLLKIKKSVDSRKFKMLVFKGVVKDFFSVKNSIIILVDFAVSYDKKYVEKTAAFSKRSVHEQIGIVGILRKAITLITDTLEDHASERTLLKRYALQKG